MLTNSPKTKILVDGDPSETLRMKSLVGFVDGQTTNPSLIAKNPEIQGLLASGHRLSSQEERDEYKKSCKAFRRSWERLAFRSSVCGS
jgi:transaldolase